MIYKVIAWVLMILGIFFSIGTVYIAVVVEESFDIIIGWIFLGPIPLFIGIYFYKYIKSRPELTAASKMGIKRKS